MPWRQSRRRQLRKAMVQLFGRRQPDRSSPPKPPVQRKYHRPRIWERVEYREYAARGWSQRRIARKFRRDHHTIARALTPAGGLAIVQQLAIRRLSRPASEVAATLPPSERETAETFIANWEVSVARHSEREAQRLAALRNDLTAGRGPIHLERASNDQHDRGPRQTAPP